MYLNCLMLPIFPLDVILGLIIANYQSAGGFLIPWQVSMVGSVVFEACFELEEV